MGGAAINIPTSTAFRRRIRMGRIEACRTVYERGSNNSSVEFSAEL